MCVCGGGGGVSDIPLRVVVQAAIFRKVCVYGGGGGGGGHS